MFIFCQTARRQYANTTYHAFMGENKDTNIQTHTRINMFARARLYLCVRAYVYLRVRVYVCTTEFSVPISQIRP